MQTIKKTLRSALKPELRQSLLPMFREVAEGGSFLRRQTSLLLNLYLNTGGIIPEPGTGLNRFLVQTQYLFFSVNPGRGIHTDLDGVRQTKTELMDPILPTENFYLPESFPARVCEHNRITMAKDFIKSIGYKRFYKILKI